jgi:hypothetical protein
VRVRAYVDEPDLGWLAADQVVEITWDAKPGKIWQGRTELAPKQVVPLGNRSVGEVYCTVDNAAMELVPNVNVEVRILVRQSHQALSVPRAAVRTDDQTRYVYLLSDNRLQRREVTVGIASSTRDEVLSGLGRRRPRRFAGRFGIAQWHGCSSAGHPLGRSKNRDPKSSTPISLFDRLRGRRSFRWNSPGASPVTVARRRSQSAAAVQ